MKHVVDDASNLYLLQLTLYLNRKLVVFEQFEQLLILLVLVLRHTLI